MRLILVAAALLGASPACSANEAPWLVGVYGNEAGCAWVKGGDRHADDSLAVLRPDGFENYVTYCDFLSVQRGPGAAVATALCGHEGEDLLTATLLIIRDSWEPSDPTKRVTDGDGTGWAEVKPCG